MQCLLMDFIISPSYGHLFFYIGQAGTEYLRTFCRHRLFRVFISDDGCPLGVVIRGKCQILCYPNFRITHYLTLTLPLEML